MNGLVGGWPWQAAGRFNLRRGGVAALAVVLSLVATGSASAQTRSGSVILGDPNQEQGVVQTEQGDGRTVPVTVAGESGRATAPGDNPDWGRYMYFGLDDAIARDGFFVARVEVEYLDEGTGSFGLQYDSNNCTATLGGAYTDLPQVQRTNSGQWRTATFDLSDARFANRENGGSDFRLSAGTGDANKLSVQRV